jgi:Flp pilus assembly protein TadD
LLADGHYEEAIAQARKAITLDPNDAGGHYALGLALYTTGDAQAADAEFRKAIALAPKDAQAHNALGTTMYGQGDRPGAIAEFRKALALEPKNAEAHNNLGLVLNDQGDWQGAIAEYRKAIALNPKLAQAHKNLATALKAQGDLKGAIAEYRHAVRLRPEYALAHCHLGFALQEEGRLQESVASFRRGHQLGVRQSGWRHPSGEWLKRAERLAQLDRQLPAFLQGKRKPRSAGERLEVADVCHFKKMFATAARWCREAFAADPKLEAANRYNAACHAALAGCACGKDAAALKPEERAVWRRQALAWLRADLVRWVKRADQGTPQARAAVQNTVRYWLRDPDLAGVRDSKSLAGLPAAERRDWQHFWAEVRRLAN